MGAGGCFFKTLNYASVNEDWRTEAEALRPGPEDTVLCVTGSGDRPLALLALRPRRGAGGRRPRSPPPAAPPPPAAGGFCPPRLQMIEMGVIYQGRWERFYR